eukprot:TRINITY_DN94276_c0_g1_i1.p1 TRINITY_DN94276_c0_g1~~TRINITY_DN94276_c0_g1_i1.p1  ORF type:complete len:295 (-),score=72.94 TRINITY_DN94276_c0_g1_i1:32-916(-)
MFFQIVPGKKSKYWREEALADIALISASGTSLYVWTLYLSVSVTHNNMAVGKSKKIFKRAKKKTQDPMLKKEWYDVVAPSYFEKRSFCKTLTNKSVGMKTAREGLVGRVFEVSLGDLKEDEAVGYRKMYLRCDDVRGRNCLTDFHGMSLTTDKYRSLVKKWCTLVNASTEVKTTDGYVLRVFVIAFTKKRNNQSKKNCYATSAKVRKLRAKIISIIESEVGKSDLQNAVKKLYNPESLSKDIEKVVESIYPCRDVFIHKVKVLKRPALDNERLLSLHGEIPRSLEEDEVGEAAE